MRKQVSELKALEVVMLVALGYEVFLLLNEIKWTLIMPFVSHFFIWLKLEDFSLNLFSNTELKFGHLIIVVIQFTIFVLVWLVFKKLIAKYSQKR
jgi:large-conductance mechanosensitive channel